MSDYIDLTFQSLRGSGSRTTQSVSVNFVLVLNRLNKSLHYVAVAKNKCRSRKV